MDNSFSSLINSATSILILLPSKPYLDQVAGGLSLFLSLRDKKETSIYCPVPMTVEFNRLIGVNKITQEIGNKNLTIRFTDYKAKDIERVSYDVENGEFRLTVIPKPGAASPKKEQVEFSYSGVSADLVILIGGANETHFPQILSKDLIGSKLAHIGTRTLGVSPDRGVMSFARPASSVSEIIAGIIDENGLSLDSDIATNLIAGIEDGSRDFKGEDVTAETFEKFAKLLRAGGQRGPKERLERSAFPQGAIPMQPLFKKEETEKKPASQQGGDATPKDWLEPKIYKGTSIS